MNWSGAKRWRSVAAASAVVERRQASAPEAEGRRKPPFPWRSTRISTPRRSGPGVERRRRPDHRHLYPNRALVRRLYARTVTTEIRLRANGICNTLGRGATVVSPFLVGYLMVNYGLPGVIWLMIALLIVQIAAVLFWGVEPARLLAGGSGSEDWPRGVTAGLDRRGWRRDMSLGFSFGPPGKFYVRRLQKLSFPTLSTAASVRTSSARTITGSPPRRCWYMPPAIDGEMSESERDKLHGVIKQRFALDDATTES